jgi:hypothetical protein
MENDWMMIIGAFALVALGLGAMFMKLRKQQQSMRRMEERVEFLISSLNALCAGAVGVDNRVVRLELRGRDLEQRQESMESQQHSDRPYGEAIQLVHKGATAHRLVEELGLSHSEAELVVMLHRPKGE